MIQRQGTVTDEYQRPVLGAEIYVFSQDGSAATVSLDGSATTLQPVTTDEFGLYAYYADEGYYREDTWFGGKLRFREMVTIGNPGADLALRSDLAAAMGAGLVAAPEGLTLYDVSLRPRGLSFRRLKQRAYDRLTALAMTADLTAMFGPAALAGTTGGAAGPVYWVADDSDDAARPNTLRWALGQAATNGSGRVIFDPRNEFELKPQTRYDVPANCTIDAPGRNVKITPPSGVSAFNVQTANVIIRRVEITHLIDANGINNKLNPGDPGYTADAGGPANFGDGISVNPELADKVWIDECTIAHMSDGAIDVSSGGLTTATANTCRYTVSRTIVRGQYKVMLSGSGSSATADTDVNAARKVFGLYMNNWYDHCSERNPRVAGLSYVDSVNNVFDLAQLHTDEGVTGEYGIASLYGGWVRTRGDLFRTLDGVATEAVQRSDGSAGIPMSAVINESSVAEGGLTIATGNTGVPSALGYAVTVQAVPAAGAAREAFRDAIRAAAGARVEAQPGGNWIFDPAATAPLNGLTVRAAPGQPAGRYLLADRQQSKVGFGLNASFLSMPRGRNLVIASDTITLEDTGNFFTVQPETGTADNLLTVNGGSDGRLVVLRSNSSANTITLKAGGNIDILRDIVVQRGRAAVLLWDTGTAKWTVFASPVTVDSVNGLTGVVVLKAATSSATYAAASGGTTVDTQARASQAQLAADVADMKAKLQAAGLMT